MPLRNADLADLHRLSSFKEMDIRSSKRHLDATDQTAVGIELMVVAGGSRRVPKPL
jgi:hypothetical protein